MSNDNCLEGLRCPQCLQDGRLNVVARVMCRVTDDGSVPFGDHDWDDDSVAVCPACEFGGSLGEFRTRPDLPPDPDGQNAARAGWAGRALTAFMAATGCDEGDAVRDLVHWCDRNGQSFLVALERAQTHSDAETREDGA